MYNVERTSVLSVVKAHLAVALAITRKIGVILKQRINMAKPLGV